MSVRIRSKRGSLYLDIYFNGTRKWEALHLKDSLNGLKNSEGWKLAEIIRAKREAQIVSNEHGLLDPIEGKKSLVSYMQSLAEQEPPKGHIRKSQKYLEQFAKERTLSSIDEKFLDGYRDFLLKQVTLSKSTASHYFEALRKGLKLAERDRLIQRNPARSIKTIKIPETQKEYLTAEELQRLSKAKVSDGLGQEVKRAFLFACCVGLRVSDLKTLKWKDIDTGENPYLVKRQQKTERLVSVPLNPSALDFIRTDEIQNRDSLVFPLLSRSKTNLNQYIKKWAEHAEIKKSIGFHTARHTFATLSLDGGADFYTVSKLLGHTKTQTTAVYAKATDKLRRQAVENLPEISILKA